MDALSAAAAGWELVAVEGRGRCMERDPPRGSKDSWLKVRSGGAQAQEPVTVKAVIVFALRSTVFSLASTS